MLTWLLCCMTLWLILLFGWHYFLLILRFGLHYLLVESPCRHWDSSNRDGYCQLCVSITPTLGTIEQAAQPWWRQGSACSHFSKLTWFPGLISSQSCRLVGVSVSVTHGNEKYKKSQYKLKNNLRMGWQK